MSAGAASEPAAGGPTDDAGLAAVRMKAGFDHVYDEPDPRSYFRVLGALDYREVEHARKAVEALLPHLAARGERPRVLDVCCSYGMLGALLAADVSFAELASRYLHAPLWGPPHRLVEEDRQWLAARRREPVGPVVYGTDVAPHAVEYAEAVGAVLRGFVEDLEASEPSLELRGALRETDLIVVAGGVGYITERTFDRLLRHATGPPPWIAALVSRVYPYDRIAAALAAHGLTTERLTTTTFPRRRFADEREQASVLDQLSALGIDSAGREADGWYHTELYVSRPATGPDVPLDDLLAQLQPAPVQGA